MNDIEHILFCMQFASLTAQQTGRLRGTILNIGDWRESPKDDAGIAIFHISFLFAENVHSAEKIMRHT